jgi:Type II secretion system (T2SS), protein F
VIGAPIVLAGAAVGVGVTMAAAALRPPPPDLTATLARLDATNGAGPRFPDGGVDPHSDDARGLARKLADRFLADRGTGLVDSLGLTRYVADLRMLGETPEVLLVRKAGYALLGLAFPPALTTAMGLLGTGLPWTIPALAALVLALVLFFVPDLDIRRRAQAARADLRQTVCAYLELVALERAADAGPIEAVERAATIGESPGFHRIRDALTRAQLAGLPPWQGLSDLAAETGVDELGDVADIMRISGTDGAAVYATLRARAASLRTTLTTQAAAAANAASEHMVAPVAALGLAFMALLGYPAFARIVFGP